MSQMKRRNVSPSTTKQGPLKAVLAFSLKNSSPSFSNSTPTLVDQSGEKQRGAKISPDLRLSPDRKSPTSPNLKEKSRSFHLSPIPPTWRTNSVDPLVPYLTGQWPKDIGSYHQLQGSDVFMCDKSTQTVDLGEKSIEKKRLSGHRRSSSLGQGDLSKEVIKQRLQRTKEGSRQELNKQRRSPIAGVHSALALASSPVAFAQSRAMTSPPFSSIPAKSNTSRFQHSSIEGLNVEIEKLILFTSGSDVPVDGSDQDGAGLPRACSIPDGHHAPVAEVIQQTCMRSVDTQTPSTQADEIHLPVHITQPSVSPGTGPTPAASNIVLDLLHAYSRSDSLESKCTKGDSVYGSPEPPKFEYSPKPEKSCPFVREPPDGCEKVKVAEETRRPSIKEPLLFCPMKPNHFVFKQSQGSAFCPLIKQYFGESGDL